MRIDDQPASFGLVATRLAEALTQGDVFFTARDEQRAEAIAAALCAAAPEAVVLHCPSSDALPGDPSPPTPANTGRRVAALYRLRRLLAAREQGEAGPAIAFLTTAEATARLYAPPAAFESAPPVLRPGDALDLDAFGQQLAEIGYLADERVDEPGEVAIRGQVIDIFPADADIPARIEIEDGRIGALRAYDPATQLGVETLDALEIGRIAEPPPRGVEGKAAPCLLFDHLPGAAVALDAETMKRRDRFLALAAEAARAGLIEPVAEPARWDDALAGRRRIELGGGYEPIPRFVEQRSPLRAFSRLAKQALANGERLVLAGVERDLRFLSRRLGRALNTPLAEIESWQSARDAAPGSALKLEMPLDRGWHCEGILVVAAADLLGSRALLHEEETPRPQPLLDEGAEIRLGDVVVHEDHGLGKVLGLEELEGASVETGTEAILLEYAGEARRLVPTEEADRLWRYGADAEAVSLDRLDGSSWEKRRAAVAEAVADSARGLAVLAAERARQKAVVLAPDPADYERFAAGFPFTETADQARAISALREDLASGRAMDRLVIGDVGYGKTEVALRAAALTALAGRQVALAAPTTVLVRQHLESFRRRFQGAGIEVAGLSRLSTPADKKRVKAGLADGSIRIVIGTGAVAGKGIAYKELGLVVVDEEQRFGAADKARLRALCGDGHLLTLSATPIPRTLQTALVGLQQLSLIATPPARRQPIRTSIGSFDPGVVRTALLREKGRGGQSFVVVSRIEDMVPMAEELARIVPELSIRQAHGKLPAAEIDEAMVRFADGDGDVLLATNIIEAGLDVPRANTMIVWRADRFGLAQLHQLRGRVGRGSRRGQVLLLTDPDGELAPATVKRLQTLQAFDRLGAGFAISARDLDMRGAGDLLGEAQAGHMKLIGVDLYQHLLTDALKAARGEAAEHWRPELELGLKGRLPADWIPEPEVRVGLYARLARLTDRAALDTFEDELEDRFGDLPDEARVLLEIARIRLLARQAGIARLAAGPEAIALTPRDGVRLEGSGLVARNGRLLLAESIADPVARLDRVEALLESLGDDASA